MNVRDVMSRDVESCSPDNDLAAAAMIMWRNDCGFVPIVENDGRVVGVITDRDICMATATRHQAPMSLRVRDVMPPRAHTVRPDEDIENALDLMRDERIRRLPVVDEDGKIQGVLSINDLILNAKPRSGGLPLDRVMEVLRSICEHQHAPQHGGSGI